MPETPIVKLTKEQIRQRLRTISEKLNGSKGELDVEDLRMTVLILLGILDSIELPDSVLIKELKQAAIAADVSDYNTYGPPGSYYGRHSEKVAIEVGCACARCRQSYPWRR